MRRTAILLLVAAAPLAAQAPVSARFAPPAPACVDSIPASAFRRTVAYLVSDVTDSASASARARMTDVDLFTQEVAERVRTLLDSVPRRLVPAEPTVTWRSLGETVEVTVARDGSVSWREIGDPRGLGTGAGSALLARALEHHRADGERMVLSAPMTDSTTRFRLRYRAASFSADGTEHPVPLRLGFPAFSVLVPWTTPARQLSRPSLSGTMINGEVQVSMEYLIDADGRVVPESIEEVRPPGAEVHAGSTFDHTRVAERLRDELTRVRWEPARTAGCAVPEVIGLTITGTSFRR